MLGPALAAWRLPTPLGGTTTHFRTRVLRELRGWDAWNVTEDADLGMRFALNGYSVGDLPSPTFEEAPKKVKAWLHQRTRWMKGFMQTSFTYARRPVETFRRLGLADSLCALVLLPGTVISALLYPILTLSTIYSLTFSAPDDAYGLLSHFTHGSSMIVFAGGLAAMLLPGLVGCIRRRWFNLLWCIPLLPLYFLLVSLAAWLAVFELARHPHRWNKTEHGLAKTSRTGALKLRRPAGVRAVSRAVPPVAAAAA